MKNYDAKDIDAYIASAGKDARPKLEEIRKLIRSTVPKAEESISWGMPFYKYYGVLAGFAAFKNHVSFGLVTVLESKEREMLENKGYKTGKKTIQIGFNQRLPVATIKQILKAKAKVNEAKKARN
jgi:uncharacterized protein YdhG (YjbR/CyaY superfamily)